MASELGFGQLQYLLYALHLFRFVNQAALADTETDIKYLEVIETVFLRLSVVLDEEGMQNLRL